MTEPERAALDHIRQVVDSVIGVPAPPEPPLPGLETSFLSVPSVSQSQETVGQSANDSGAAAGAMLVRAYHDSSITPIEFYEQTGQSADNPLSFTQIMNGLSVNGVPVELRSNLKLADLSLILFSGRPVIAPVKQTILQPAGLAPEALARPYYVVVVGMDVKKVFLHDPLRGDASGQVQGVPWLTFYQAWTQAPDYERAVLVPRQQLLRRVRVAADLLDVYEHPGVEASLAGKVSLGELFEVTKQKKGWGKIGEDRWINLSYTTDI